MFGAKSGKPLIRPLAHPGEFRHAVAVRRVVFVQEQACPEEEEFDPWDAAATHFLVEWDGAFVGTARFFLPLPGVGKIGRVALLPGVRGRGWGHLLLRAVEAHAAALAVPELILDAQVYALPFYARLGYVAEGPEFLDAGIPHRRMRKRTDLPPPKTR